MISKARIKFIKSLQIKKYRLQEQRFIVEGAKSVLETLQSDYPVEHVYATSSFISRHEQELNRFKVPVNEVRESDLSLLGAYTTNDTALAIVKTKANTPFPVSDTELVLALDDIRDPGNLGTIIRIADWYGLSKIVVSPETADLYNPKVIHATMGSFTRVQVYYTKLAEYLSGLNLPVFGAFMEGSDVHKTSLPKGGVVVIGNEAHGISDKVSQYINHRITIPRYGKAESLNAAVATAIICDVFKSRTN